MLRNALLNPVKDMTTNFHKLMVLYIIRKNKKNIPQRVAVYSHYFCVKLAYLQAHHREVVIRIGTSTMLLNLTLKFLNNLH